MYKSISQVCNQNPYPFKLPDLPYAKNALEPYITTETIDFHYGKHHQTYVTNLNNLIVNSNLTNKTLEELILFQENESIFNNASQVWNHTFYWHCLKKFGGGKPESKLYQKICDDFESFENFTSEFKKAALTQFGSGWAWLVYEISVDKLKIVKTSNAQNPITKKQFPLLTCDVWEHAYYVDFRNRRNDYVDIFIDHLINWEFVLKNYETALLSK